MGVHSSADYNIDSEILNDLIFAPINFAFPHDIALFYYDLRAP